jgi:hypothetical protein
LAQNGTGYVAGRISMTNDDILQHLAIEQFSTQKNWQLPWYMLKREPSVLAVGHWTLESKASQMSITTVQVAVLSD